MTALPGEFRKPSWKPTQASGREEKQLENIFRVTSEYSIRNKSTPWYIRASCEVIALAAAVEVIDALEAVAYCTAVSVDGPLSTQQSVGPLDHRILLRIMDWWDEGVTRIATRRAVAPGL